MRKNTLKNNRYHTSKHVIDIGYKTWSDYAEWVLQITWEKTYAKPKEFK
jgi:hypothetical protein